MKIIRRPFDLSSARPYYHNLSGHVPFAAAISRHSAGTVYQYDMHYGLEFGIVMSGQMTLVFPGLKFRLQPGNVWFCGMWEPHGWAAGRTAYAEVNLVVWPPALAGLCSDEAARFNWLAPFTAPPQSRPQTNGKTRPAMLELGGRIAKCIGEKDGRKWLWLRLFIMEAILLATEQWLEKKQLLSAAPGDASRAEFPHASARLNQVLNLFFDKRGQMTTTAAAKICGLNRNAFSKMFRGLMGLPFADFALRYRLSSAASALRGSDESVKCIALFWGFADTSHFDRMFAKYYACTPVEYRQKKM